MLAAADTACYFAKKQGSGRVVVYSARDEALARHTGDIQWLQRLQGALKENRFHLYHQVIVPAPGVTGGPAMEVFVRLRVCADYQRLFQHHFRGLAHETLPFPPGAQLADQAAGR